VLTDLISAIIEVQDAADCAIAPLLLYLAKGQLARPDFFFGRSIAIDLEEKFNCHGCCLVNQPRPHERGEGLEFVADVGQNTVVLSFALGTGNGVFEVGRPVQIIQTELQLSDGVRQSRSR
jgi:hypothetical protein